MARATTLIRQTRLESQLGRVLAQVSQNGYTLAIHAGASQEGLWPGDPQRVGTMSITSPEGVTVRGGYWMDWPESHWGLDDEEYQALSIEQRAALEASAWIDTQLPRPESL